MPFPHPRARWVDPRDGALLPATPLMQRMAGQQAVLLGETHDIAEIHRWQLQVATCLHLLNPTIAVGYEMFPRRLQPVLDGWVAGDFTTEQFLVACEWNTVWGFHPDLYLPLFHFCRQQGIRMLALNCHRPLVTRVGKEGWDAIPVEERDGLSPALPATPAYRDYLRAITGSADPVSDRFVRAQQTWDRAFACNIAKALDVDEPPLVVGIIGRGHLEYGHGTPAQLQDLGVKRVSVLLPNSAEIAPEGDIADALFRLDEPEPASTWRAPKAN